MVPTKFSWKPPRGLAGRRAHLRALTASVAAAACVVGLAAASGPVNAAPPARGAPMYLDAGAPVPARVDDLLRRMTLAEKVGQMDQIVTGRLRDKTNPADGNCTNAGATPTRCSRAASTRC